MNKFSTYMTRFAALILLTGIVTVGLMLTTSEDAKACRDCPFPMRIADGKWMMPNGLIEIEIQEVKLPSRFHEVHVVLRDARTGEILASGISKQRKDRKTVNIQMVDTEGNPIVGYVRYVGGNKEQIQAKFTCETCEIREFTDGEKAQ